MRVEEISNNLEGICFDVFNMRYMTATWTAPNRQAYVEPLPLVLVTLTRNIKSQRDIQAE
jgi:hypothetical protein